MKTKPFYLKFRTAVFSAIMRFFGIHVVYNSGIKYTETKVGAKLFLKPLNNHTHEHK